MTVQLRDELDRPLTFAEGDANFSTLLSLIEGLGLLAHRSSVTAAELAEGACLPSKIAGGTGSPSSVDGNTATVTPQSDRDVVHITDPAVTVVRILTPAVGRNVWIKLATGNTIRIIDATESTIPNCDEIPDRHTAWLQYFGGAWALKDTFAARLHKHGSTGILANAITRALLEDMPERTFLMRAAGAGTGDPIHGTALQAATALYLDNLLGPIPSDATAGGRGRVAAISAATGVDRLQLLIPVHLYNSATGGIHMGWRLAAVSGSAGSFSVNLTQNNGGNYYAVSKLTADLTLSAITNAQSGSGFNQFFVETIQGSSPHRLIWPASCSPLGGIEPELSQDEDARDLFWAISSDGGVSWFYFLLGRNIESVPVTVASAAVDASNRDANEVVSTGVPVTNGTTIGFQSDRYAGIQFGGLGIPQGAVILEATIQFTAEASGLNAQVTRIWGEAADQAAAFTTGSTNITARAQTTASVDWTVPTSWSAGARGPSQKSPTLRAIVQEIIDRPGWSDSNYLGFFFQHISGAGSRAIAAFDHATDQEPVLTVRWSPAPEPTPAAEISYDNGSSGLAAVDVQDAIDELAGFLGGELGAFDQADLPTAVADYRGTGAETLAAAFAAVTGAGSLPVDDTTPLVRDPVDNTRLARIDAGAVATGTTRVLAMGDRDVDLAAGGTFAEKVHEHPVSDLSDGGELAGFDQADLPTAIADYRGTGVETLAAAFAAVTGAESLPVDDTTALVRDPVDNTRLARIDAGAVATGTTRVLAMGDRDVDLAAGGTFAENVHEHPISDLSDAGELAALDEADLPGVSADFRGEGEETFADALAAKLDAADLTTGALDGIPIDMAGEQLARPLFKAYRETLAIALSTQEVPAGGGPIHRWTFDEGTDASAADSVGSFSGTLAGGASWQTPGRIGGSALQLDGVDGKVALGNVDLPAGSAVTILAWVRAASIGTFPRIFSKASGAPVSSQYCSIAVDSSGLVIFVLRCASVSTALTATVGAIAPGEWRRIACRYNGAEMRIFVSGASVGSTAKTGTIDTSGSVAAAIGGDPGSYGNSTWAGRIDQLEIFDRALSDPEIAADAVGTALVIDMAVANLFERLLEHNVPAVQFSNLPAAGVVATASLFVKQDAVGGRTIAFPGNIEWPSTSDGNAKAVRSGAGETTFYMFTTRDGGVTWLGF